MMRVVSTPSTSAKERVMTPLRRRMIEDMKLKNLAPRTIEVYTMRVAAFARHFGRSPAVLSREEVRSYLLHLVQEKHVSWSVFNQTVAALRFLYEVTLDREGVMVRIRCPKQPKRLPIVLSLDEMARFFAAVIGIKHPAILMTAYGAGLRHSGRGLTRRGHRQPPHGLPRSPRQRPQRSLRDAVAAPAGPAPRILEGRAANRLALSRRRPRTPHHRPVS